MDGLPEEILERYRALRLDGLDDSRQRPVVDFLRECVLFLRDPASLGHRLEPAVLSVFREVEARVRNVIGPDFGRDVRAVAEMRALAAGAGVVGADLERRRQECAPPIVAAVGRLERRRGSPGDLARRWRVTFASTALPVERGFVAAAWVRWAATAGVADLAAEAYQQLVTVVPQDVAARRTEDDRNRVLAAAQEHIEDAGYWLCRAERYREAVLTLETGRAITLRPGAPAGFGYDDVRALCGDGALVYIAAAKAGGYALIVVGGFDPQFVNLPDLDRATAARLAAPMLAGLNSDGTVRGTTRDLTPHDGPGDAVDDVLSRLWRAGLNRVVHNARGTVVTYIPVGLLALLPLHAAGTPRDPRMLILDEWQDATTYSAVRYAPNARALRRSLDIAAAVDRVPLDLLAVDVPEADGQAPLEYAARETTAIARTWPSPPARLLRNGTWAEFRRVAGAHAVWHLACHGAARPEAILDSELSFADARVTLAELRDEFDAQGRRLAVLSACESNVIGAALPNEAVGLPTALLGLGFAGVIASAWKVDDAATAYLMAFFYRFWCGDRLHPAVALTRAQHRLREATWDDLAELLPDVAPRPDSGDQPFADARYWAAFAYTGA